MFALTHSTRAVMIQQAGKENIKKKLLRAGLRPKGEFRMRTSTHVLLAAAKKPGSERNCC